MVNPKLCMLAWLFTRDCCCVAFFFSPILFIDDISDTIQLQFHAVFITIYLRMSHVPPPYPKLLILLIYLSLRTPLSPSQVQDAALPAVAHICSLCIRSIYPIYVTISWDNLMIRIQFFHYHAPILIFLPSYKRRCFACFPAWPCFA